MSISETLDSIKATVRSARQHAYLGVYEDSVKSFNKSLEAIKKLCNGLDDPMLISTWKSTANDLENERDIVNNLKNIVKGLKNEPGKDPISRANNGYGSRQDDARQYEQNYVYEKPSNNRGYEAQEPISFNYKDRDGMEEENKNNNDKVDYIYVPKRRERGGERQNPQKDPDVWDPPSPKDDRGKRNSKPVQKVEPRVTKPKNKPELDNRRPGKKPTEEKKSNQSNDKDTDKEKKSFLYHCYPDGKGPDAELIQMLEKDVVESNPNVKFEDIASLEDAKQTLQEAVLLPLLCPELFIGIRRPWSGVLMFGPPGTGKTLLAKAVATQGKTSFFNITAASIASKYRGESERLVRLLFEIARFYAPTTIFLDEIDALGSKRGGSGEHETSRRVLSELLIQMDGMNSANSANANEQASDEQKKTITVIGATNRPWDLDEALRRRLEKRIYIPLPNEFGRKELFRINLKGIKLDENVDFDVLVKSSEGYSGADIASVCREASMMPIRKKLLEGGGLLNQLKNDIEKLKSEMDVPITQNDFLAALKNVHKSVSNTDLDNYVKWMAEFGSC